MRWAGSEGGRVRRVGRRAPHAERAVMLTAVQSLRRAGSEGRVGRAGRRAPHAERAVILTAVQSLRLLVRRGCLFGGRRAGVLRTQREL